jgi:putative flippase GtrA
VLAANRQRPIVAAWYAVVPQPIRFVVVGGANSLVGLSVIWFNMAVLGLEPIGANALAYALLLPLSLWTFARGVFSYSGALQRAIAMFLLVFFVAVLCNLAVVSVLVRFPVAAMIAQGAGLIVYVCVYYPLSRMMFAYLKRPPDSGTAVSAHSQSKLDE